GKQLVMELKDDVESTVKTIEEYPSTYKLCKHELPAQLEQLNSGIKEMIEEGYHVGHLGYEEEIRSYKEKLNEMLKLMDEGLVSKVQPVLNNMEERIKEIYDLLEKEALAKNYLETKLPMFEKAISDLEHAFTTTKYEVEQLQKTYYFEDRDMENYLSIENTIANKKEQLIEFKDQIGDQNRSHSELRDELEKEFLAVEELEENHKVFRKRLHTMRKDELEAKAQLEEMRKDLFELRRRLNKSNIPGIPSFIRNSLEEVSVKNDAVLDELKQQPLEMKNVQEALNQAKEK